MANNYTIRTVDKELYFGGWNSFGEIVMYSADQKSLSNRMCKTVALRNVYKIENFTKRKCEVVNV